MLEVEGKGHPFEIVSRINPPMLTANLSAGFPTISKGTLLDVQGIARIYGVTYRITRPNHSMVAYGPTGSETRVAADMNSLDGDFTEDSMRPVGGSSDLDGSVPA